MKTKTKRAKKKTYFLEKYSNLAILSVVVLTYFVGRFYWSVAGKSVPSFIAAFDRNPTGILTTNGGLASILLVMVSVLAAVNLWVCAHAASVLSRRIFWKKA